MDFNVKDFVFHKLCSTLTGGYYYNADHPTRVFLCHTIIYMYLMVPLILTNLNINEDFYIIHPLITFFIWILIKATNMLLHKMFDSRSRDNTVADKLYHRIDDDDPPLGISKDVWRIRDRITDFSNIGVDSMVEELIHEGYDVSELLHFYELYFLNKIILNPKQVDKTNFTQTTYELEQSLNIDNSTFNFLKIKLERNSLEAYFDRPFSYFDVVVAPFLACVCGLLYFNLAHDFSSIEKCLLTISTASSQYALLKAPAPDTCSTTVQDPSSSYSRACHLIFFSSSYLLFNYLQGITLLKLSYVNLLDVVVSFSSLSRSIAFIFKTIVVTFPATNMLGFFGSAKDSWFCVLELIERTFFGKSGCITLNAAHLNFIIDFVIVFLLSHILLITRSSLIHSLVKSAAVSFGYFNSFIQSTLPIVLKIIGIEHRDFCVIEYKHMISQLWFLLWRCITSFLISFICLYTKILDYPILSILSSLFLVIFTFLIGYIIPNFYRRYPFRIYEKPFLRCTYYLRMFNRCGTEFLRFVLFPITISSIIYVSDPICFGLNEEMEYGLFILLILFVTSQGLRNPVCYSIALIVGRYKYDVKYASPLFQIYLFVIIIQKYKEFNGKLRFVLGYSMTNSATSKFWMMILALMVANAQFTILSVIIATFLTSPIIPIFGYPVFLPSYPRPSNFWFDPIKFETKFGDSIFYKRLSDSLSEKLATDVAEGVLFDIEGKFFLICDDYFNALVHIISVGVGYVVFQMRGLEVRKQTLCHQNELTSIRSEIETDEIRSFTLSKIIFQITDRLFYSHLDRIGSFFGFPSVLQSDKRDFLNRAVWLPINNNYILESYEVLSFLIVGSFEGSGEEVLLLNIIRTLSIVIKESDIIYIPENLDIDLVISDDANKWFESSGRLANRKTIIYLAKILIKELHTLKGDLDHKIFKFFYSEDMGLHNYKWIQPSSIEKICFSFRVGLSLAIHEVSYGFYGSQDELIKMITDKMSYLSVIPENHFHMKELIENKVPVVETMRQVQDDDKSVIKYVIFKLKKQSFKLIEINGEAVKGIWASQTMEILFAESTNRERSSIQYNRYTLRNILSQSANSPVGYPEVICPYTFSFCSATRN